MKTLFLLRHASAEPTSEDDHARWLTRAGRGEAAQAATWLAEQERPPALALCSPAARALGTLEAVRARLPELEVVREPELYLASAGEILARVQDLPDALDAALVVAHNPGLAALARSVPRDADAPALAGFPPATVAVAAFDRGGWPDVAPGRGRLLQVFHPHRNMEPA